MRPAQQPVHKEPGRYISWFIWSVLAIGMLAGLLTPRHAARLSPAELQNVVDAERQRTFDSEWYASIRDLDPEARERVEKLRAFRDKHWTSQAPGMKVRAVQANREIRQIVSLGKLPDDREYRVSLIEEELQELDAEIQQTEAQISSIPQEYRRPRNSSDPPVGYGQFIQDGYENSLNQLDALRHKRVELEQRLDRERQIASPSGW